MKVHEKLAMGLDLNGVWDHCVRINIDGQNNALRPHDDLGARSVVVRANLAAWGTAEGTQQGKSVLVGGMEALESVYGRGEAAFGAVGRAARRMEIGDAWRRIRGEYESGRPSLLKQDVIDEEAEITAQEALLAQARTAMGSVTGGHARIRIAGIVMRDDEASTEAVQDEIRRILGWNALGGTRVDLVWDSVAVAKAALKHDSELREGAEIAVITSYGKRIRVYRLGVREEDGRRVPERFRDEGRSGQSLAYGGTETGTAWAEGWDIWTEGWDASLEAMRGSNDLKIRAVVRQTRLCEEWAQEKHGKALVRIREGNRARWTMVDRPWVPKMQPLEQRKIAMGDEWSQVVIWTPMGRKATEALASCVRMPTDRITLADASWAAEGAALAAYDINRGKVPWYDRLDRMTIKVERDGEEEDLLLVDETESVPAGTAYRTSKEQAQVISKNVHMTEGMNSITLNLTKGQDDRKWCQKVEVPLARKPRGRAHVELRARQLPGQGSAVIELRSKQYEPWRDAPQIVRFSRNAPDRDAVKPALILYEPAEKAWESGPEELLRAARMAGGEGLGEGQLRKITNWLRSSLGTPPLNKEHAVGTNGQLPGTATSKARDALDTVLEWTENELLEAVRNGTGQMAKQGALNALHLIHTWCFERASPHVLEVLIQATEGVGRSRQGLQWDKSGAQRAIWQGLGRSAASRETIERVLDGALRTASREEVDTMKCDALAAASHLLARRHIAGLLVLEDGQRAKKAAAIACEKIRHMSKEIRHSRTDEFTMQQGLQLRYAVLLAGGLARVKDMNSEYLQPGTEAAGTLANALDNAVQTMDGLQGWTRPKTTGLKPIMEGLRDVFGKNAQPDTNLLKLLDDR